jgi:hypothetical protein
MLPGTGAGGNLTLYKLTFLPTGWERCADVSARPYVRADVTHHDGLWWILANSFDAHRLDLFHAPSPLGPWTEHASNGMGHKVGGGSNSAGRLIRFDDKLYRFGQRLVNGKLLSIDMYEVTKLTPTDRMQTKIVPAFERAIRHLGVWSVHRLHSIDFLAVIDNEGVERWLGYVVGDPIKPGPQFSVNIPSAEETFDQRLDGGERCHRHGGRTANSVKFRQTEQNKLKQITFSPTGVKNYPL